MASVVARTAQRLDAEYDGGHSDVGEESADSEDSPMKLQTVNSRCTARAKHAFRLSPCWTLTLLLPRAQKDQAGCEGGEKGQGGGTPSQTAKDGTIKLPQAQGRLG